MKQGFVFSMGVCAFIFLALARPLQAGSGQYVKVESSLANIYEFLDPRSNIIRVAKEGDRFEMIFEGTSWYQIKVQDKVGWLEKKSGSVVIGGGASSNAGTWIAITILFLGMLGGVYYYINKQKLAEA
jgi:hypothetical protein